MLRRGVGHGNLRTDACVVLDQRHVRGQTLASRRLGVCFSKNGVSAFPSMPWRAASANALSVAAEALNPNSAGTDWPPARRQIAPLGFQNGRHLFRRVRTVRKEYRFEGEECRELVGAVAENVIPFVSTSSVLGRSRMDLAPALTTATSCRTSSSRSALMSHVSTTPRCTPPMRRHEHPNARQSRTDERAADGGRTEVALGQRQACRAVTLWPPGEARSNMEASHPT